MATSGSFDTNKINNFYFTFEWSRTGYSSINNEHYISYRVYAHNTAGNYRTVYLKDLYVNGKQVYYQAGTSANGKRFYNGDEVTSGTATIASSNSSGDGSFSASFSAGVGQYPSSNCSGSGSWTLDRIPRFASITNNPASANDESTFWFDYTNPANTSMSCWLEVNPAGEHRAIHDISGTGGRYTWTLTEEERDLLRYDLRNSNTGTIRIGLYSTIGSTTIASYKDIPFSIINASPIFEDFTFRDTNTTVTAVTENDQVLVKGLSTLQATISSANKMETKKQATPKNYGATIDNININANYSENDVNINIGTIPTSGTKRLNVRAYDSRNNSTLVYKDITVYDYNKPIINSTVERLNNFENTTTLKIAGTFTSLLIDNQEKNTIQSIQYRYRELEGTWGNYTTITPTITNNTYSCNDVILTLDNTKTFEIEVQVTDELQTSTVILNVDVGEAIFFISSNRRTCYINNEEIGTFEKIYPVGSIYMSVVDTNPADLFGIGTWVQIAQGRTLVGVDTTDNDFATVGQTGGSKTTTNLLLNGLNYGGLQGGGSSGEYRGRVWVSPSNIVNDSTNAKAYPQSIVQPYYTCYIWLRTV